jgi:hypothetical protein
MAPALDRIPQDWHVLTVCRAKARGRDWVALMNDEPPRPGTRKHDLGPPAERDHCLHRYVGLHKSRFAAGLR